MRYWLGPLMGLIAVQSAALPAKPTLEPPVERPEQWHSFGAIRKLKVGFLTRGTVFVAHDYYDRTGGGLPAKLSDRLFYTDGEIVKKIATLNSLRGFVRIRTPEDALSFVRLRTSPSIFHAYDYPPAEWAEILAYEDVKPELLFGVDEMEVRIALEVRSSGFMGIVSKENFKAMGARSPIVTALPKGGYRIERAIVVWDWSVSRTGVPQLVTETVTPAGTYKVVKVAPLPGKVPEHMDWTASNAK